MTSTKKQVPAWILIVSGIFALLEIMVSILLCYSPESALETVDLQAKGVLYVVYMWSARQFALGFIFGFATLKKSAPMLTLAYIFFLVMMIGDLIIGVMQEEHSMVISAVVMSGIAAGMIYAIKKVDKG